jgi:hypothetical protein
LGGGINLGNKRSLGYETKPLFNAYSLTLLVVMEDYEDHSEDNKRKRIRATQACIPCRKKKVRPTANVGW